VGLDSESERELEETMVWLELANCDRVALNRIESLYPGVVCSIKEDYVRIIAKGPKSDVVIDEIVCLLQSDQNGSFDLG
jgi:hypothetical protein